MHGPVGLGIGGHAERAEPPDVVGVDDLDVGDVGTRVAHAVGPPRRLDRVERLADGSLADGVEVRLEPERVQARDVLAESLRVDQGRSAVVVWRPSASR